jgi:HEXXH motif-containing protein
MLGRVRPVLDDVLTLVRSIQVLQSEDDEIDVSYSHPGIAFSIFVSLCKDISPLSDLRVAESILHEAMHLKLTLIEKIVPLVKVDTGNRYYSPWREELRPARGVLHGMFVFRTILDFFRGLGVPEGEGIAGYLTFRKEQIIHELRQLRGFYTCPDFTPDGAILTENLLPSN